MALQINLAKTAADTAKAPKLKLNLNKGSRFRIELFWDDPADLDAHALLAVNSGAGGKITGLEQVLSTYLTQRWGKDRPVAVAGDGSFTTPCKSLVHSPDEITGVTKDVDEYIDVDGSLIPQGINEIPIFVTIHEGKATGKTFATVKNAGVRIKDSNGRTLAEYQLSSEFGPFNGVQMGSLMLGANGWEFAAVGVGIDGDFNTILEFFS